MKKILLTAILSYFFLIQSYAQVAFGIKAGAGFSVVGYKDTENLGAIVSSTSFMIVPSIYGIVSIPLGNAFAMRTGVGFSQQAYSYLERHSALQNNWNSIAYTDKVKGRLNYLEVPLIVAYKLPFAQRKFDLVAGGSFGLNLGGRAEVNSHLQYQPTSTGHDNHTEDYKFNTDVHPADAPAPSSKNGKTYYEKGIYSNRYNWSVLLGINYQLSKHLLIGVEAQLGLSNVRPIEHTWKGDEKMGKTTTQSYMFTVTYILGKSTK